MAEKIKCFLGISKRLESFSQFPDKLESCVDDWNAIPVVLNWCIKGGGGSKAVESSRKSGLLWRSRPPSFDFLKINEDNINDLSD